jgi:hypothetical protein
MICSGVTQSSVRLAVYWANLDGIRNPRCSYHGPVVRVEGSLTQYGRSAGLVVLLSLLSCLSATEAPAKMRKLAACRGPDNRHSGQQELAHSKATQVDVAASHTYSRLFPLCVPSVRL